MMCCCFSKDSARFHCSPTIGSVIAAQAVEQTGPYYLSAIAADFFGARCPLDPHASRVLVRRVI
jgi:hypothetical protein